MAGKPCFRCGAEKRYKTQSYCYKCLRELQKERYRRLHPEKGFFGNRHGRVSDEDLFVVGRGKNASNGWIRERALRAGHLENRCSRCGRGPTWEGEDLTLELDHINGDWDDNRIENLRILCPNCHSQCPTSKGGNRGKARKGRGGKKPGIQASRRALHVVAEDWRNDAATAAEDELLRRYLG